LLIPTFRSFENVSDMKYSEPAAPNESTPNPSPHAESPPHASDSAQPSDSRAQDRARLDREVADAMAAMAPEDLAELGGGS